MGTLGGPGGDRPGGGGASHPLVGMLDKGRLRAALEDVCEIKLDRMRGSGGGASVALRGGGASDIEHVAEAHEMAAIDMWRYAAPAGRDAVVARLDVAQRTADLESLCRASFGMLEVCPVPDEPIQKICHVLLMFSYAYVGERWESMRRYLNDHDREVSLPDVAAATAAGPNLDAAGSGRGWEYDMLAGTYEALLCVIRKRNAAELRRARSAIGRLREMQVRRERPYLESFPLEDRLAPARRLASLYHLAKCVDLLAEFMETGEPDGVEQLLDFHFDEALSHGDAAGSPELDVVLRAVRPAFKKMVRNSVWILAKRADDDVAGFVGGLTASQSPVFEFLYPQRTTALEEGLLDPYSKSMLINLPTSGGKTLLAELKIVQAVRRSRRAAVAAYVVPTRTLVNQMTSRLRRDLGPAGIRVEKMSGAVEIDGFEDGMLARGDLFDVLVTTPEKLMLLIRNPGYNLAESIALCIIDEAHNLGDAERGLNLELLISTIKRDCRRAGLLLLTPFIPNSAEVAEWLDPHNPKSVTVGVSWKPNDRVVGAYYARGRGRRIETYFRPLATSADTIKVDKTFKIGTTSGFSKTASKVVGKNLALTSLLATQLDASHSLLVMARTIRDAWSTAGLICDNLDGRPGRGDAEVELAKRFIASELGERFPLVGYLDKGVGVHHSGLPDEARFMIERLMEMGKLRALVGTTTIAQGVNFPVSAVLISSYSHSYHDMDPRDFWNLVGRAGRIDQPSFGLVGIAADGPSGPKMKKAEAYVKRSTERLASSLARMVSDVLAQHSSLDLSQLAGEPRWSSFVQYVAHMRNQAASLDEFTGQAEVVLRQTLGYGQLGEAGRAALRGAVREYAGALDASPGTAAISDLTGFSPGTVRDAAAAVKAMGIEPSEWSRRGLFSPASKRLSGLIGVMAAKIPEVGDMSAGMPGKHMDSDDLAGIIADWVSGKGIPSIAQGYFGGAGRDGITDCVRAIYGRIIQRAAWGLAGIQRIYDHDREGAGASPAAYAAARNLPAMVYYGVDTDEAVLMRMNSVPRSVAGRIGAAYVEHLGRGRDLRSAAGREVREWLSGLDEGEWVPPAGAGGIAGREYKMVWSRLSGEEAAGSPRAA